MNNRPQGFTLIEIIVVVIIIGILATIALVVYNNFIDRTRVTEAWSNIKAVKDQIPICVLQHRDNPFFSCLAPLCFIDPTLPINEIDAPSNQRLMTRNFYYHCTYDPNFDPPSFSISAIDNRPGVDETNYFVIQFDFSGNINYCYGGGIYDGACSQIR